MRNILWFSEAGADLSNWYPTIDCDFRFLHCSSITGVHSMLDEIEPAALIIDCDRQEHSAIDLFLQLKSKQVHSNFSTIIISSSSDPMHEIGFFKAGADDFLRKPFPQEVLMARLSVRCAADRKGTITREFESAKRIRIDHDAYAVYLDERLIPVSRKEFELLNLLAGRPDKVFTREEIFQKVWNRSGNLKDRTIDVHILRIRKKLGGDFIHTQKGVGYRLLSLKLDFHPKNEYVINNDDKIR